MVIVLPLIAATGCMIEGEERQVSTWLRSIRVYELLTKICIIFSKTVSVTEEKSLAGGLASELEVRSSNSVGEFVEGQGGGRGGAG